MQAVDQLIRDSLQSDVMLVSQVSEYIVTSGGKRLRPLIVLLAARALGYETVGEGVETPTQFAFLRLNGCTTAQGWYFGKPAPEAEFVERLLADRRSTAQDDRETVPNVQAS